MTVELDSIKYIDSIYQHVTKSSAGREEEFSKIELGNQFWPIGLTRTYKYDYQGGYDGLNLPTTVSNPVFYIKKENVVFQKNINGT